MGYWWIQVSASKTQTCPQLEAIEENQLLALLTGVWAGLGSPQETERYSGLSTVECHHHPEPQGSGQGVVSKNVWGHEWGP